MASSTQPTTTQPTRAHLINALFELIDYCLTPAVDLSNTHSSHAGDLVLSGGAVELPACNELSMLSCNRGSSLSEESVNRSGSYFAAPAACSHRRRRHCAMWQPLYPHRLSLPCHSRYSVARLRQLLQTHPDSLAVSCWILLMSSAMRALGRPACPASDDTRSSSFFIASQILRLRSGQAAAGASEDIRSSSFFIAPSMLGLAALPSVVVPGVYFQGANLRFNVNGGGGALPNSPLLASLGGIVGRLQLTIVSIAALSLECWY